MKTTHLSRKAIAIVAIIASSFCFASPALAGNSAKTGWSAYLTNWQTSDTPNRQKQNSSDGFISASSVSGGRTIRAWMLGYSNEDVRSGTVTLTSGFSGHVTNQTYQLYGRKQVHMRLQNTQSVAGTEAAGLWAPDSN
mgnify:CR=1 FL=1